MGVLALKVVFLGVGGWISKPLLGHTSVLIVPSLGKSLLLDAGEGVVRALYSRGFRVSDLEGVVITHLHGDHVLGLPTLIMLAKHYEKTKGLHLYALRESISDLEFFLKVIGVDYTDVAELHAVMPGSSARLDNFNLYFEKSTHTIPALSVKVEVEDKCIVYSGDTAYSPLLVKLAEKCDLLIHEASGYSEEAHLYGHSTVRDALKVAVESGVKKLALVHYYVDMPALKIPVPEDLEVYLAYPGYELYL